MKAVTMLRDFDYRPRRAVVIHYRSAATYRRVPEAVVRAILEQRAGTIVEDGATDA